MLPERGNGDGPEILIVGNAGREVDLLVPEGLRGVHTCQPWAPRPCSCGDTHPAHADADLSIFVGADARPGRTSTSVAILPDSSTRAGLDIPAILAEGIDPRDFGPFAARVIRHLVAPILIPGLLGISLIDVLGVLTRGRRLRYAWQEGGASVPVLAERLVAHRWWDRPGTSPLTLLVGVTISTQGTLGQVDQACSTIAGACCDEANLVFYALIDEALAPQAARQRVELLAVVE